MANSLLGESGPAPGSGQRTFRLGLALILALAAGVRFHGLAARELWFDENCTFYIVHHLYAWPNDGPDPWREVAHVPYFVLLHAWTRVTGETIWGMRSFSALVGCLGVVAMGLVGLRMSGRAVGLISAALAAVHPLHIHYSREARGYTVWLLAVTGCVCLIYEAARSLRARWWLAYAALAWITVLSHYYTLLLLPGTAAAMLVARDRRRFRRQWLVTHAALAIALVPVVWVLVIPLAAGGAKPWFREVWVSYPPALAVPKSLWAMLPSGGYPSYLGSLTVAAEAASKKLGAMFGHLALWGPTVGVAALTLFVAVARVRARVESSKRQDATAPTWPLKKVWRGLEARVSTGWKAAPHWAYILFQRAATFRSPDGTAHRSRMLLFLFSLSLAYLLAAFCHSWLGEPTYVVGRYDLAAWPSLTLGIALLIDLAAHRDRGFAGVAQAGIKQAAASTVLTAALAGCSIITLAGTYAVPITNDLTHRARRIAATVSPDDLVVSLGKYGLFMLYEWHRLGFSAEVISFPPNHDRQLCWYDAEAELSRPAEIAAGVASVTRQIEHALETGRRVWLLAHGEPTGPRWQVDQNLFARLRELRIDVVVVDELLGLAALTRRAAGQDDTKPAKGQHEKKVP